MTQHEYVFVVVSMILGLAITRLLSSIARLIRAHERVDFHWATGLWGVSVMLFALQLWWVGWDLRTISDWVFADFFVIVVGAIFIYGAAELALPMEDFDISDDSELHFLAHSHSFGRGSALAMLGYFCIGPYVNIMLFENPALPSIGIPLLGGFLMLLIVLKPGCFRILSPLFLCYAILILYLTA